MNAYEITFSMFLIIDGNKISRKNHFSNCKDIIKGDTYEEALKAFKEKKRNEGWFVVTLKDILR
ncbi:hypothetical protein [Bacillus wiedmannii]|uniref:hypothetical protein n=1 Tax=Bacillus wiedmannii TaxID=1890302 RepID=UPI003D19E2DA